MLETLWGAVEGRGVWGSPSLSPPERPQKHGEGVCMGVDTFRWDWPHFWGPDDPPKTCQGQLQEEKHVLRSQ